MPTYTKLVPVDMTATDPHTVAAMRARYQGARIDNWTTASIRSDIATIEARMRYEMQQTPEMLMTIAYLYSILAECVQNNPSIGRMT
jgi:hypothetical protein